MKKNLSTKQEAIVEFIKGFLEDHHFPPTVRDIQAGCEISSTSVVDYNLRILPARGIHSPPVRSLARHRASQGLIGP